MEMFPFSFAPWPCRAGAVFIVVLVLLVSACTAQLSGQPEPEGQSVRVYTPAQVARALSDPVLGQMTIGVATPDCGSEELIPCPASAYAPSDFLGQGGNHLLSIGVGASRVERVDIQDALRGIRTSDAPDRFVLSRANVLVEGPKRLRDHVLALLRALPKPTTRLGDVPVPTHRSIVRGDE